MYALLEPLAKNERELKLQIEEVEKHCIHLYLVYPNGTKTILISIANVRGIPECLTHHAFVTGDVTTVFGKELI